MARNSLLRNLPLPGHAVGPNGLDGLKQLGDMEGLEVEMTSEQVDLSLLMINGALHLDVEVTFTFKNHADEDTQLDVCYPIGLKNNVVTFGCETDGVVHEPELKSREEQHGRLNMKAWFYEWSATYPAGETVMHKVSYRLSLWGANRTGYTVSSGGPWKGRIAKSVVTLKGTPEAWSHVRRFGPVEGAKESGGRIVWKYSDYDPTPDHDIWINYQRTTLDAECNAVRGEGKFWNERCKVVSMRAQGFYAAGRLSLDEAGQRALRAALTDLISEATDEDGCTIMPASERRMVTPPPE